MQIDTLVRQFAWIGVKFCFFVGSEYEAINLASCHSSLVKLTIRLDGKAGSWLLGVLGGESSGRKSGLGFGRPSASPSLPRLS